MQDKEVFYELCEKYGVELSDKVDTPKIILDGATKDIDEEVLRKVFEERGA